MVRNIKVIVFFVLFSLTAHCAAFGGWKLMKAFNAPVACGYFFDKNNGMVGLGNYTQFGQLSIYITSDGGVSWTRATTPGGGTGWISSIHMINRSEGYASIFSDDFTVWKTIDGGHTWIDRSGPKFAHATCIYATSKAVIQSFWRYDISNISTGSASGGRSLDEGTTVKQIFASGRFHESNGIDFTDDLHGVVLMGPSDDNTLNCWITVDGGVNWTAGGNMMESWGVYALKGTQTYFALPEGFSKNQNQDVYRSNDWGRTWNRIFTFNNSFLSFTGHIAGGGNSLYVQTRGDGLFRSDDLGSSWKSVGGPDNFRDTRFVVTGCVGETVYAFTNDGEVWKTTDGGDGTLIASGGNADLSFSADSLFKETRYCQPLRWDIALSNPGCGTLTIDAITLNPNPYNEFTLDPKSSQIKSLLSSSSVNIPVDFQTDSNVTRRSVLRIQARANGRIIDTTIILVAKHSTAPEPYIGDVRSAKVGDSVGIPIYLKQTRDSFAMKRFSFHLSYDGDILTPTRQPFITYQTLSAAANTVSSGEPESNGLLVTIDLPKPITQDSDLTKPLITIQMGVTLSRYLHCPVRLDTFAITNSAPLPLCTIPLAEFIVDPICGDKSLSDFMFNGKIPALFSVYPNPASGNKIEAIVTLAEKSILSLDVLDVIGNRIRGEISGSIYEKGVHRLEIGTSELSDGIYYLRLRTDNGSYSIARIVISR